MAWLTSRSETRRQRETGWPRSDPPCCQYISVKGGKLADSIPVSLIGSIHTLRCSGSVLMPLKHKHTSLCTVHCLFVLSTTKERSFSAAQYLSLNDFPARVMRRDPFMWTPAVPTVWSILKKLTQDGETRVSKYKTSKSWNVVTSKNDDHQHLISVKWQHESSSACCRCGSSNNPPAGGAASPRQHPSRHLHYQQRVTKRTIQTVKNAERRIVWVWTDSILLCHIQFIFCLFLFLLRWNSSILTK